MIASTVIDHIRELLAEGQLSQRKIAQQLGLSRGTVANVAHGRRPDRGAIRRKRKNPPEPFTRGHVARCPECGAMVHMPCFACRTRRECAGRPQRGNDGRLDGPFGLDLHGDVLARYEGVHRRRMEKGEPFVEVEVDPRDAPASQYDDWEDWT
ncbi:MAG: winged helix-turn-helix transcriptional regulator [Pirellulales bacterium]|nr:winged helix-turn-helix transcriptional regulator [Pirellulales bacterium]